MPQSFREQLAGPNVPRPAAFESIFLGGTASPEDIRRARRWLFVVGLLAVIDGVAAIAVPVIASVATAIFIGWILLVAGIAAGVHAISHRLPLRGLEAILSLIAGIYILVSPLSGTVTLTFVLAVWFFATGVVSLITAAQQRGAPAAAVMTAIGGVLSVILGFLIAASLPSSAAWAIGLLVGINLIFWGIRALAAAQLFKRLLES
jgi:uncharacterized membrane protein HdeD (DUF308 family)